MSRMESPRDEATITFRVDSEKKDAYKEAVANMSDDLREHVEEVAESVTPNTAVLPEDDTLRNGFLALQSRADPDTGHIPTEAAESAVSERTKVKQKAVRRCVLDPLERRGYIRYQWGTIVVLEPEVVNDD